MNIYVVQLTRSAQKQLDKISESQAEPIFKAIEDLAFNPRPYGFKKLKGRKGYRIRIGDYRVIYDIFDRELIIDVITLGHRKDVYNS